MKLYIFLVFILLGIGRNLPFQNIYFFGLGPADLLFCVLCFFLLINQKSRLTLQRDIVNLKIPIQATVCMSALAMLSLTINAPIYGAEIRDIFEILKYFYLIILMIVTSYCTRAHGVMPIIGFVLGVMVSGVVAFLNPMNPDVLGIPQIFNPNVIGNVLSVSVVFCSLTILKGAPGIGGLLAICASGIAFFTFSKGTWLMTTFALCACFIALAGHCKGNSRSLKYGKYLACFSFTALFCVLYIYRDFILALVGAKIAATDFGASATEGGSFSARAGLILSAFHMFLENPFLGVGISNFEHVNNLFEIDLGSFYYADDNPNSAWFYVLGCMGLPAFILFSWIFYWFLKRVYHLRFLNSKVRLLYTACIGMVFFVGGNVQLQMLTAYYYWVALGIVAVCCTTNAYARA